MTKQYRQIVLILLPGLVFLAGLLGLGAWWYANEKIAIRTSWLETLHSLMEVKTNQVMAWRQERLGDAAVFSELLEIKHALQDNIIDNQENLNIQAIFRLAKEMYGYDDILLVNRKGEIILHEGNNQAIKLEQPALDLLNEALKDKKILFSNIYYCQNHKQVHLDLVAPVIIRQGAAATAVGGILFTIDPTKSFYPLVQFWPTPSLSAEALIVQRQGDQILFLTSRHQQGGPKPLILSMATPDLPAVRYLEGHVGPVEGADYRGRRVLAVGRAIPGTPWVLGVKVDLAEIYQPLYHEAGIIAMFIVVLVLLSGAAAGWWRSAREKRHYQELSQAEWEKQALRTHYDYLMKYANDIILLLDRDGNLREVNDRAVAAYGSPQEELLRLNIRDLVAVGETPALLRYSREDRAGSSTIYECRHRRRDGSVFPVEVSVNRMQFQGREYVQEIIRDITERRQAEAALRESESRFRAFFEQAAVGLAQIDSHTGQFILVNQKYGDIVGKSREELLNTTFQNITHPDDLEADLNNMQRLLSGEILTFTMEKRYCRPDDAIVWVNLTVSPLWQPGDSPTFHLAIVEDITDRKRVEEELFSKHRELQETMTILEQSRKMLQMVLESIPVRVFWKDADSRFLGCNTLFAQDAGFNRPEQLLGQDDFTMGWREQAELYRADDRQVMESGLAKMNIVEPQTTPTGATIWLNTSKVPLRPPRGEVFGVLGVYEDITPRKEAEAALRESEEKYRGIFDESVATIFLFDANKNFIDANQAGLDLLGYSRKELLHLSIPDVDADPVVVLPAHQELLTGGRLINYEHQLRRQDGSIITVLNNSRPLSDGQGNVVGMLSTLIDITERRRLEQERLEHLRFVESLDQINRALQKSTDLEATMDEVLGVVLALFDCDRAYLVYPCDPETQSWQAVKERTRPEYPGALATGRVYPLTPEVVRMYRVLREAPGPVSFGEGAGQQPLPPEDMQRFSLRSMLNMAIYPKGSQPYLFGLHQCSSPRDWTPAEVQLFQEIGHRLADVLTSLLMYQNLKESEAQYRLLVNQIPAVVYKGYPDGSGDFFDDKIEALTGYPKADFDSRTVKWFDLILPDDFRSQESLLKEAVDDNGMYNLEYRIRQQDGEIRWIQDMGQTFCAADGTLLFVNGLLFNITDRKRLEAALRESELFLKETQRLARLGGWQANPHTDYLKWTEGVYDIIEEPLDYHPILSEGFKYYLPETIPVLKDKLARCLAEGTPFSLECQVTTTTGKLLWTEIRGLAPFVEGERAFVMGTFQDITARKQAEAERRELETQLFQAQKMESLGTLAGGIAHDFNNILWGIMGFSELTFNALPEGSKERANLQQIIKAAARAGDLVKQILAFSRKAEQEKKPLQLALILEEAMKLLRATIPTTIEIKSNIASAALVLADATQLHQVIMNLGTNAAYAMRETGDTLEIGLTDAHLEPGPVADRQGLAPGPYVKLTVRDNGPGIAPDIIDKIFEPFFTTKGVGEGTGMGLAVVYGIVRSHGGAMSVSSRPGEGAVFTMLLPAIACEKPEDQEVQAVIPRGQGHILVVDDEEMLVKMMKLMLTGLGYTVTTVAGSLEALELFQAHPGNFDLVLTDQTMPQMDGLKLAWELRQLRPDIPIILITGFSEKVSQETVDAAGINAILLKPINLQNLGETVKRIIDKEK
jgi:PAS domain S-box-containing protein